MSGSADTARACGANPVTGGLGSAVAALMLFVLTSGAPAELRPAPVVLAALLQQHGCEQTTTPRPARAVDSARTPIMGLRALFGHDDPVRRRTLQVRIGLPPARAPDDRAPHA